MASKPMAPFGKMKRPSQPYVQTNTGGSRPANPSPSPSSATKRLPGQTQTPSSATSNAPLTNGVARPNRRPQRVQTRTNTTDGPGAERRTALKEPEPCGGLSAKLHVVSQADFIHSPQRTSYSKEIQGQSPFTHSPPPPDAFSIRSARWQFQLSVRDARLYRTPPKEDHTTRHAGRVSQVRCEVLRWLADRASG